MYERLGREVVDIAIRCGDIQFIPLETIKGMSFGKGTVVMVDESEDVTIKEAKIVNSEYNKPQIKQTDTAEFSFLSFRIICTFPQKKPSVNWTSTVLIHRILQKVSWDMRI